MKLAELPVRVVSVEPEPVKRVYDYDRRKYMRDYHRVWREKNREHLRAYLRNYMRTYRAK